MEAEVGDRKRNCHKSWVYIHFASGFCSYEKKKFKKYLNENLVCVVATISSLANSSREFLKFFHFNRAAKNKGFKRNNQVVKLDFK